MLADTSGSNRLSTLDGVSILTDAVGNITNDGNGTTFVYGPRNRMSSSTNAQGTTTYSYNALGERVKKSGPGGTTIFAYDEDGHLIGEYTGAGTMIQEIVWFDGLPVVSIRPAAGGGIEIFNISSDHLGTPRVIRRSTDGVVVWKWDSDPFGNGSPNENPSGLGTFKFNLRFPGQYADAETGLNYNYFRDYNPRTGRYAQSDPIGLSGGMNTYVYAENRPHQFSDRFGLTTALCTRKLSGFPFRIGPLFHQYVCVGNEMPGYICKGLGPSEGNLFNTPGKLESDSYSVDACTILEPDNRCVENCLLSKFSEPAPNYSIDLSRGENCQTYSAGIVSDCLAKCRAKPSDLKGAYR